MSLIANPYLFIGAMLLGAGVGGTGVYKAEEARLHSLQTKFDKFKIDTEVVGKAAQIENAKVKAEGKANLTKVKEYEEQLPKIRSGVVAAYIATHPPIRMRNFHPSSSSLPHSSPGQQVDDGTICQQIPDPAFLGNVGESEAKLAAWQEYGRLNHLPIE